MNGIASAVCEFINENTELTDKIYFDVFPKPEGPGVICRHDPGRSDVRENLDGSLEGECNLSFHARSRNAGECRDMLYTVLEALNGIHIESGKLSFDVYDVSEPQFVGTDDKGQVLYTASVGTRFMRESALRQIFS